MTQAWTLALTLRSPFLTGNAGAPLRDLDAAMPRTREGHLVFPGTLLRGVIRDALDSMRARSGKLLDLDADGSRAAFGDLFGTKSPEAGTGPDAYKPGRGRLYFGDLISTDPVSRESDAAAPDPALQSRDATRIEIDQQLGATREGHLQRFELIGGIGAEVPFTATISLLPGKTGRDLCERLIRLAFSAVTAIGTGKTAGFGHIVEGSLSLTRAAQTAQDFPRHPDSGGSRVIVLVPDGPFLVDASREADNAFMGAEVIPGSVIKGALADSLPAHSILEDRLDKVTIGHAFPFLGDGTSAPPRQTVLPLSLALHGGDEAVDHAHLSGTNLLQRDDRLYPPVFEVDWKDKDRIEVREQMDAHLSGSAISIVPGDLDRRMQVRTAIDAETGAAQVIGDTGQLFSYDAVAPARDGKPVSWAFRIRLPEEETDALLDELLAGSVRFGKLNTPARFRDAGPVDDALPAPVTSADGELEFAVVLQSPAVLFTVADLAAAEHGLEDVLPTYFKAHFPGFELKRWFARQSLAGGYPAVRYPVSEDGYQPWILTDPGSVFVLGIKQDDLKKASPALAQALAAGLPVGPQIAEPRWRHCPYLRESGFGHIRINVLADLPAPGDLIDLEKGDGDAA